VPQDLCRILCSVAERAHPLLPYPAATLHAQLCSLRNKKIHKCSGVNERVLVKSKNYQKNIEFRYGNTASTVWLHRRSRQASGKTADNTVCQIRKACMRDTQAPKDNTAFFRQTSPD